MDAFDSLHGSQLPRLQSSRILGYIPAPLGARFPFLVLRASAPSALPALRNLPRTPVTKSRPIHLVELCGGICAFLEAFLRNGYRV
jgi:hypothetical protein